MKKIIALILALAMVACFFAGCGEKEEDNKTLDIIYVTPSTASDFWSQVETGILQTKKDYEAKLGITINYQIMGPAEEVDAEGYVSNLENAISQNPDAIVTATLNIDPTVPKAMEATNAGIILNFVNCGICNGDMPENQDYYNQFYYCSNTTIGEMAAQAFLTAMDEKGLSKDAGTVGMQMNMENAALDYRMTGFRDYMAANAPGLKLTDTQYNGNDSADAQADAEGTISAVTDLIGFYAGNNVTCDGVCNALRAADMKEGDLSYTPTYYADDSISDLCISIAETNQVWTGYINDINSNLDKLSHGDFNIEFNGNYVGDFAKIKESVIRIADKLSDIIGGIDVASNEVALSSASVASSSNTLAEGVSEQSKTIDELMGLVEKMVAQITSHIRLCFLTTRE